MKISFFDFDGTITKDDSMFRFIRFAVGDFKFVIGLFFLSPVLILFKLKIIPNYQAKIRMISYYFKGYNIKNFDRLASEYSLNHIDKIVKPGAIEKIQWHKNQGHKVVVVSASIDLWLRPWCEKNDIDLIATEVEVLNGIVTGKFKSKNCYGIEKVNRIKKIYNLDNYKYIYAYGDSKGDMEMLELAHSKNYKVF